MVGGSRKTKARTARIATDETITSHSAESKIAAAADSKNRRGVAAGQLGQVSRNGVSGN